MDRLLFQWIILPVACLGVGFASGWKVHDWRDASGEVAAVQHVAQIAEAEGAVSTAVGVRDQAARDRIRTVIRTMIERVPVHVTPAADARCSVPVGFVRVHDAAAAAQLSAVPAGSSQSDDAASGVALSAVASTVVANYGTCRDTARQLTDLQVWLTAQQAAAR